MNIGRSIKIALAKSDRNCSWLAGELGVSKQQVSKWNNSVYVGGESIRKLASAFGMRVSTFIALGEGDIKLAISTAEKCA